MGQMTLNKFRKTFKSAWKQKFQVFVIFIAQSNGKNHMVFCLIIISKGLTHLQVFHMNTWHFYFAAGPMFTSCKQLIW